jgi:hypothetical protein
LFVANKDGENPRKIISLEDLLTSPAVSPDGQGIVVAKGARSLVEIKSEGAILRTISQGEETCCGSWTADGEHLLYLSRTGQRWDIWALPTEGTLFHHSMTPAQLTVGPLSYSPAISSRDGKQIFGIGTKARGELIHFDLKLHRFLPFLSGISATDPTFSGDGNWVAYVSYPDYILWRSRKDGTERKQLTYPPLAVYYPYISPDGRKIEFMTSDQKVEVIDISGGPPQAQISLDKGSIAGGLSPNGNLVLISEFIRAKQAGEKNSFELQIADLLTGKKFVVPLSRGMTGALWISDDALLAANETTTKLAVFNFKTQKWTDIFAGAISDWMVSPDQNYVYFTTAGADPKAQRIRLADRKVDIITSIKDAHQVMTRYGTQINVAPDGSPVFTRDIGTQEFYALKVRWP